MTQEDRIFELEKTLENVLDLFNDTPNGKVYIVVDYKNDGYADGNSDAIEEAELPLPGPNATIINEAIRFLYSDEEFDD